MAYLPRIIDPTVERLVEDLPAIAVEGAKGVGKTESCMRHARTVIPLDDSGEIALLESDKDRLTRLEHPILIDEWQFYPPVWDMVRRRVDQSYDPGQFILTGSATPRNEPRHSGAGRIVRVQMRPMSLVERGMDTPTVSMTQLLSDTPTLIEGSTKCTISDYAAQIERSGFPGLVHVAHRSLADALDGYLAEVLDHGAEKLDYNVRLPGTLRQWLAAYASATATTAAYTTILSAATPGEPNKPSYQTTLAWREMLTRMWLLDPLPAWTGTRNHQADLGATPKHHLADPALALRILGLSAESLLTTPNPDGRPVFRDATLLGALFESLVTLCVRVYAQPVRASVSHLRTRRGDHEVDLIVTRDDGKVVAIEVKASPVPSADDVSHLHWLKETLGPDLLDAVVVTSGPDAYRRSDGIGVVPAALLGP